MKSNSHFPSPRALHLNKDAGGPENPFKGKLKIRCSLSKFWAQNQNPCQSPKNPCRRLWYNSTRPPNLRPRPLAPLLIYFLFLCLGQLHLSLLCTGRDRNRKLRPLKRGRSPSRKWASCRIQTRTPTFSRPNSPGQALCPED